MSKVRMQNAKKNDSNLSRFGGTIHATPACRFGLSTTFVTQCEERDLNIINVDFKFSAVLLTEHKIGTLFYRVLMASSCLLSQPVIFIQNLQFSVRGIAIHYEKVVAIDREGVEMLDSQLLTDSSTKNFSRRSQRFESCRRRDIFRVYVLIQMSLAPIF